jgi:hypothetical protein
LRPLRSSGIGYHAQPNTDQKNRDLICACKLGEAAQRNRSALGFTLNPSLFFFALSLFCDVCWPVCSAGHLFKPLQMQPRSRLILREIYGCCVYNVRYPWEIASFFFY